MLRVLFHEPELGGPTACGLAPRLAEGPQPGRVDVAVAHGNDLGGGKGCGWVGSEICCFVITSDKGGGGINNGDIRNVSAQSHSYLMSGRLGGRRGATVELPSKVRARYLPRRFPRGRVIGPDQGCRIRIFMGGICQCVPEAGGGSKGINKRTSL